MVKLSDAFNSDGQSPAGRQAFGILVLSLWLIFIVLFALTTKGPTWHKWWGLDVPIGSARLIFASTALYILYRIYVRARVIQALPKSVLKSDSPAKPRKKVSKDNEEW